MIAHPGRYKFTANEEYALFLEFKAHGGRAIEVVTGSHSPAEYVEYADKALEFGFAASRGSDFHSPDESHCDLGKLPWLPGKLHAGVGTAGAPHPVSGRPRAAAWLPGRARATSNPSASWPASAWCSLAVACFATLDTATKLSTAGVPILMGVWFRYAFQAVATTAVLLPRHGTGAAAHRSIPSTSCCAAPCCWRRARSPSSACATCRWPSSPRSC